MRSCTALLRDGGLLGGQLPHKDTADQPLCEVRAAIINKIGPVKNRAYVLANSMESQLQDENAEATALVSSFSLNVASQYPNDIVANAVFEQELAQRRQRPTEVRETRNWRQFYEGIGSEGYVSSKRAG